MNHACWSHPPRYILDEVLQHLNYRDLSNCEQVCHTWKILIDESYLWKDRFIQDFHLCKSKLESEENWKEEYRRLTDCVPCVQSALISEHKDEVLHVSFSVDGSMFCTCSKDATAKVFEAAHPFSLLHTKYFGRGTKFSWLYTQFSQFNQSTTQLLISGKCAGYIYKGEIAIYAISEKKILITNRIPLSPYDAMGAWFDSNQIVMTKLYMQSGDGVQQISVVRYDCAESSMEPTFLFSLKTMNIASYMLIANLTKDVGTTRHIPPSMNIHPIYLFSNAENTKGKQYSEKDGTNPSIKILICFIGQVTDTYHQVGIKIVKTVDLEMPLKHQFRSSRLNERQSLSRGPHSSWDHVLELEGQAVGMTLSHCNSYLFVNVRKWVNTSPNYGKQGCPLSSNVTMLMFDLFTMQMIKEFRGHIGISNIEIFFLGISSCNEYVASGSEDKKGYIWDAKYGIQASTLSHSKVVNCVSINPCDPSMAVSVSDDNTIKIWHSRLHRRENAAFN